MPLLVECWNDEPIDAGRSLLNQLTILPVANPSAYTSVLQPVDTGVR
jgi:hypothetical protein